jgi:hypothetical protein
VKSASLAETPEHCAAQFAMQFDKLSEDLLNHQTMARQDSQYRVQLARKNECQAMIRLETALNVKFDKQVVNEEKAAPSTPKVCSGHLGKQLSALRKDGGGYACGFDKNCTFSHISIAGKSD